MEIVLDPRSLGCCEQGEFRVGFSDTFVSSNAGLGLERPPILDTSRRCFAQGALVEGSERALVYATLQNSTRFSGLGFTFAVEATGDLAFGAAWLVGQGTLQDVPVDEPPEGAGASARFELVRILDPQWNDGRHAVLAVSSRGEPPLIGPRAVESVVALEIVRRDSSKPHTRGSLRFRDGFRSREGGPPNRNWANTDRVGPDRICNLFEAEVELTLTAQFRRGDVDRDSGTSTSDAVRILRHLFVPDAARSDCHSAMDTNGDEVVGPDDAVRLLGYLFTNGPPLAAPFSACGPLPADATCDTSVDCS